MVSLRSKAKSAGSCSCEAVLAGYEGDRERVVVGRTGTEARLVGNKEEENGARITVVVE